MTDAGRRAIHGTTRNIATYYVAMLRSSPPQKFAQDHTERNQPVRTLIVIGASAGGSEAISTLLKDLSHDIPAAIVVMTHVAHKSTFKMAKWLARFGHIHVVEASSRERLREAVVFIAPPGHSLIIQNRHLTLEALRETRATPNTIDRLFESAARFYRDQTIGVVLTGGLADGSRGLQAIHDAGGLTVIQNLEDAHCDSMPRHAVTQVPDATFRLDVEDIGLALDLLARRTARLETGLASSVRLLKERIRLLVRLLTQSKANEATSRYLSEEVTSLQRELRAVEALLSDVR